MFDKYHRKFQKELLLAGVLLFLFVNISSSTFFVYGFDDTSPPIPDEITTELVDTEEDISESQDESTQTDEPDQTETSEASTDPDTESIKIEADTENSNQAPLVTTLPEITDPKLLGNWTNYNGIIFEDAILYKSHSGGGLAVADSITLNSDYSIGSTYSSEYNPAQDIGEYKNEGNFPAFLFGGDSINVGPDVTRLDVLGGNITMNSDTLDKNSGLSPGFHAVSPFGYEPVNQSLLDSWFEHQRMIVKTTSKFLPRGNRQVIDLRDLSSGSYLELGADHFKNQYFEINDKVYENALFINVSTDSDVNFGQWWPIDSRITLDVNWAIDYDLVVFNFPDAVNVSMNSSAFDIKNTSHWSTTVDAWIGERGMIERLALAEKVVFNFPQARSVEANQALIQGTILAPDAAFTGIGSGDAGHIYGHIIARRYIAQGNFTIHAFHLSEWAYDLVEDSINKEVDTGSITLRHYLYFRNNPTNIRISDGEFVLKDKSGNYFDGSGNFVPLKENAKIYTSSFSNDIHIEHIPLGEYELENIAASEGFVLNTDNQDNSYTYARYPVVLTKDSPSLNALRYSETELRDVVFQKVDQETKRGLAGARFTIVRESDEYEDTTVGNSYLSDEDGFFISHNLPPGIYHLTEIEAPNGYELLKDGAFGFEVYWDNEQSALLLRNLDGEPLALGTAEVPIVIDNIAGTSQNTIVIIKHALEEATVKLPYTLPGGEFSLHRFDDEKNTWELLTHTALNEPIHIVTNELGYDRVQHLTKGRYRLTETKSPLGYELMHPYEDPEHSETFPNGYAYEFVFDEETNHYTALIPNRALTADITIQTIGKLLNDPTPLKGSSFKFEHLLRDGETWEELLYSVETDSNGQIHLSDLRSGTYRLKQLRTAPGYQLAAPGNIQFDLNFDEEKTPDLVVTFDSKTVDETTYPVSKSSDKELSITVWQEPKLRDFSIYKIDGDYTVTEDPDQTLYHITYLEGAVFRLQRRTDIRTGWVDYGDEFTSEYLYDYDGKPILDASGNHICSARFHDGLLYGDYKLIETKAPEGFTSSSSHEVLLNDGTKGYQVYLFTITENMTGTGQETRYTIADYSKAYSTTLQFRNVDASNHNMGLNRAEFILYSCNKEHVHDEFADDDSCWSQNTPIIAESNGNGLVTFHHLVSREYRLEESRAPTGYELPRSQWKLVVDAAMDSFEITTLDSNLSPDFITDQEEFLLPNKKKYVLPFSGGSGTTIFFIIGLLLIGISVFLLYNRNKRKPTKGD